MDSVPREHDFSIQRDNEHILIRMLQREGYLPSLFCLQSQELLIYLGYLFHSNIFLWAGKIHQDKSD